MRQGPRVFRQICCTLFFAAGFLCAAPALWAQQAVPVIHLNPDQVRQQMIGSHEALVDVNNQTTLAKYIKAIESQSNPEDQEQLVQELMDFCLQHGLNPSPDVAEVFLFMSRSAATRGDLVSAPRYLGYAQTFDAGLPQVHLSLAEGAKRRHGVFSVGFLYESLAAWFDSFTDYTVRWISWANLALWLRLTSMILLGVLALLLFLKYNGLLRHDVLEWLGGGDSSWARMAGWMVVFLPSLIFLSWYWWIVYWCGVFFLYARGSERWVVLSATVLFVLSGAFAAQAQQNIYLSEAHPQVSNIRCYANRIDVGTDAYLSALASEKGPNKATYQYILANRYLLHGSFLKAETLYKRLLQEKRDVAGAANNLGCLYYFESRFQEAIQQFSYAVKAEPGMAVAFFNRSLARNKLFDFTGAKADQDRSRSLDASLFARLNRLQNEDWVPLPVYPPLSQTRRITLNHAIRVGQSMSGPLRLFRSPVDLLLRPAFSLPAAVMVLLFLLISLIWDRSHFSRSCLKCGRPFCSRCKTSLEFESFCAQCVHMFIKQDGVSPEARLRKTYEVQSHNRFLMIFRSILSLIAPGAGHFWEGRPISAFFILFLWCGLLAGFLVRRMSYGFPFNVPEDPLRSAYFLVAAVLLTVIWLSFGLTRALSRKAPPWGDLRPRR
ncbi:MAG: tetratricopeptide repeat protein [Acidobacteriota bacterium]